MVVLGSRRTRWFGYCSYPNERCTSERSEYSGRPGREPASTKFTTTVSTMGSEVNRAIIITSASMPTYKLPTHWYSIQLVRIVTILLIPVVVINLSKRADGGTSNVWYSHNYKWYFAEYGNKMAQTADAVFMPVESTEGTMYF